MLHESLPVTWLSADHHVRMHFNCNMLWNRNSYRAYDTIHPSSTAFPFRGLKGAACRRATSHITEQRSSSERVRCVGVQTDHLPSPVFSIGHNTVIRIVTLSLPSPFFVALCSSYLFSSAAIAILFPWVRCCAMFEYHLELFFQLTGKLYRNIEVDDQSIYCCWLLNRPVCKWLAIFCARPLPSFDGTDAKRSCQISQFGTVYFIYLLQKYCPQNIIRVFHNVHTITLIIYS